jgi:hypothetical protein
MSTQLILYPQTYDGTTTFSSLEFVVDGIVFNSINSSTSYETGGSINAHLATNPPSVVNTWFRWRKTLNAPAYPSQVSTQLKLNSIGYSFSGVYQKLSNLTVGASYTLTVNVATAAWTTLRLQRFSSSGATGVYADFVPYTGAHSLVFTAGTTTDIIYVQFYSTSALTLSISSISVSPTGTAPSEIYSDLSDGQVICDLYQEEDIPLTLSVDDFKNVAEKVQSYSKDFNLPATKRNNLIFNNMFDITRSDDGLIFNPYAKTKCVLKQDGFILFEGSLRLIDVKDKEGEISYSVNLYSEVIALADTLKDSTFSEMDFSELEHLYNKTSIKQSWDSGLPLTNPLTDPNEFAGAVGATTTQVLKYPFIDWTGNIGITTNTSTASGPTPNNPQLTSLEQAFRPCIQLKYLIDKIFADAGFNYTSDFFDSADFGKLFMDFNWGSATISTPELTGIAQLSSSSVNWAPNGSYGNVIFPDTSSVIFWPTEAGFNPATSIFTATVDGTIYDIQYEINLRWYGGSPSATTCIIEWYSDTDGVIDQQTYSPGTGSHTLLYSGSFRTTLNALDTFYCRFKADSSTEVRQSIQVDSKCFGTVNVSVVTSSTLLNTLRGDLGQWEFLKGIFTMFNLVTMVDETDSNNILIEPYSNVFINNTNSNDLSDMTLAKRSIQHDWTDKIDVSEMELNPLTDLNKETIFKFTEDDDDFAFNLYKRAKGKLYGSREFQASSQSAAQTTMLEGLKEITAEPFAATVSKPLYQQFPTLLVPCVYSRTDDGSFEGFDNSPRVFYNNGKIDSNTSYYIPPQTGLSSENQSFFLQFSHLSTIPTQVTIPPDPTDTIDFYFGSYGYISPIGTMAVDNLYSLYWQPYFNELYNPDTRTMTLKVNLTPADINTFKFYDVVFIKNRSFRVNTINYKPNDLATVEFILIP